MSHKYLPIPADTFPGMSDQVAIAWSLKWSSGYLPVTAHGSPEMSDQIPIAMVPAISHTYISIDDKASPISWANTLLARHPPFPYADTP